MQISRENRENRLILTYKWSKQVAIIQILQIIILSLGQVSIFAVQLVQFRLEPPPPSSQDGPVYAP